MSSFSYSFCMSMMHSLWQAGLLLLLYVTINKVFLQGNATLQKRNLLFAALGLQLVFSISTFLIYFVSTTDNAAENSLNELVAPILSSDIIHSITPWLFLAYIAIISFKLIKAVYSWQRFKKQYKIGLVKPGIDLKLFTKVKAYHLGIKRKVTLWFSQNINTPVTFGFFKPVILLPLALLNQISTEQAETLILHELSHIRVNDYLFNWFLITIETLFFFNPFILSLCKKIRIEREKYCDSTVIEFNYPAMLYAETLLKAERIKQLIPAFQMAAVSNKKHLLQRIQFFTDNNNFSSKKQRRIIAPLLSSIIVISFITVLFFRSIGVGMPSAKRTQNIASALPSVEIPVATVDPEVGPIFVNAVMPDENNTIKDIETSTDATTDDTEIESQATKIADETEKQQVMIDKKLKAMQPYIRSIQDKAEAIARDVQNNIAIPAAVQENDADREIVVKEEGSGKTSVKVYNMKFQNGQWVIQPQWMASAARQIADSLGSAIIDTMRPVKVLKMQ